MFSAPHSLLRWRGQGKPKVGIEAAFKALLPAVPPGGDYRASHGRLDGAPLRHNESVGRGGTCRLGGTWAKCARTVRHPRGPAYCGLDWGSTDALADTAMLAQQPRKPLTPVHSAAEPPDVRRLSHRGAAGA
jgi:hypothetical protein